MTTAQMITFEIAKLIVQLAGALLIARLTVMWALQRFKSEKNWERENAALADVMTAIGEVLEVNYYRAREFAEGDVSTEFLAELVERHEAARRQINTVGATAALVLSGKMLSAFEEAEALLHIRFENDEPWIDYLQTETDHFVQARTILLKASRAR